MAFIHSAHMIAIGDEANIIQIRRRVEAVGRTIYILEIYVDILQCRRLIATKKISNHEIDVMARAIESINKPIHSASDVFTAQLFGIFEWVYALAFNDGVGLVYAELRKKNNDIRLSLRKRRFGVLTYARLLDDENIGETHSCTNPHHTLIQTTVHIGLVLIWLEGRV